MPKYNELHIFIDESGQFSKENDTNLVGGVLLFGPYDDIAQSGIKNAMVDACKSVGMQYPPHYKTLKNNEKQFSVAVEQNIAGWRKITGTTIYGVTIQHKKDIHSDASDILAEQEYDNRYRDLLWALVEYVVFASNTVNKRLEDKSDIYLYIAHRRLPVPMDGGIKETYLSRGYKLQKSYNRNTRCYEQIYCYYEQDGNQQFTFNRNEATHCFFETSLSLESITAKFAETLRVRWTNSGRNLKSVQVPTLFYNREQATPASYLADIVLGVERKRIQRWKDKITQQILPIPLELQLEYGEELDTAVRRKVHVTDDNIAALMDTLVETPFDVNDSFYCDVVNSLVEAYRKDISPFYRLYETVSDRINSPILRNEALQLLKLLDTVSKKSGVDDLRSKLNSLLIWFSYYNHKGDTESAEKKWEQYLEIESQLPSLGAIGLEFKMMFRNRWAVTLIDQREYKKAEDVLLNIACKQEDVRKNLARTFEIQPESIPDFQLGAIYGTLGQSLAFQGEDLSRAENCFRFAISCFVKPEDKERQWVYLGHLACDHPSELRQLWDEVAVNLPGNTNPLENPFLLALKLKAILVFYDTGTQKQWAQDTLAVFDAIPENARAEHPFGLIMQVVAMICAKLYHDNHSEQMKEVASQMFDGAIISFNQGDTVLKELREICAIRKQSFADNPIID